MNFQGWILGALAIFAREFRAPNIPHMIYHDDWFGIGCLDSQDDCGECKRRKPYHGQLTLALLTHHRGNVRSAVVLS
jgi:hypothetical protein